MPELENSSWTSHPRPSLKRKLYHILNQNWRLNHHPIQIPFPPQSDLSGYQNEIPDEFVYTNAFRIPETFVEKKILLNFGAIDQVATVKLNGRELGTHYDGYQPFSYDITNLVSRTQLNQLEIHVTDTLSLHYPYGKQSKNPKGMWYTPVSGIWQPVWLENVPEIYIEHVQIDTTLETVSFTVSTNQPINMISVEITMPDGSVQSSSHQTPSFTIPISQKKHWTPDTPYLYNTVITAGADRIQTYFALRTIEIKDDNGIQRVFFNNKPIFLHGVLDQGYFKDGIFLPATETDYDNDIKCMKELGFNLLRKHIKIEPDYFYYACDKHGMLVMQDMVNSGPYSFFFDTLLPTIGFKKKRDKKLPATHTRRKLFESHIKETIHHLYNHPCIIAYTIFNEGWGQFNSDEMYDLVKTLDSTRLIDTTSGWFAQNKSDFDSEHVYFRTKKFKYRKKPIFLSECGGFKLLVKEHFYGNKEYGYGACKDKTDLTNRILAMYKKMVLPAIKTGLCGCIYTQLSDVEGEINGIYTYDRKVLKVETKPMQELAKQLQDF